MNSANSFVGQFIADSWWLVLLRGIALFLFGLLLLFNTGITLVAILAVAGAFWFVDGMFQIVASVVGHRQLEGWGWGVFGGILGVLAGIVVMLHPVAATVFTELFLVYFFGIAAIGKGISDIYLGVKLRKDIKNEWAYILGGTLAVLYGVLIMLYPVIGIYMVVWLMIILALSVGLFLIIRSFQLKKVGKELAKTA